METTEQSKERKRRSRKMAPEMAGRNPLEKGLPSKSSDRTRLRLELPPELLASLRAQAAEKGLDSAEIVRLAITQFLAVQEATAPSALPRTKAEKQEAAALLLVSGKSVTFVAGRVGASPREVDGWLHLESFQSKLDALWESPTQKLERLSAKAIQGLEQDMDSPIPGVRHRARQAILAERTRELEQLQQFEKRQRKHGKRMLKDNTPLEKLMDHCDGVTPELKKSVAIRLRQQEAERNAPGWLRGRRKREQATSADFEEEPALQPSAFGDASGVEGATEEQLRDFERALEGGDVETARRVAGLRLVVVQSWLEKGKADLEAERESWYSRMLQTAQEKTAVWESAWQKFHPEQATQNARN
jgi:hypothetical protein